MSPHTARPLTVLQLLPALDAGGVERGTLEVAGALARAGHRSLVLSAGGRLVEALVAGGSEHLAWPVGRKSLLTLRLVPRLRRLLVAESVDVLHARSRMPAWIAWHAWRRLPPADRPAFVTTVHGLYSPGRYSSVMARGERVIVGSETVRDYVRTHYPTPEQRLRLIPRGVSRTDFPAGFEAPREWRERWLSEFPGLRGKRVLTLAGRLTRLKGHRDLLDVLALIGRRRDDVAGLVVGGEQPRRARYARDLRHEASARGLPVIFTGHRTDVREIYAASDVVLSLSRKPESFGRTVLEALSLGVPAAGYDHGGVGELLGTLYPAGACPTGDVAALAERVERLLEAPPPVPEAHGFTLERMLEATLALYAEVAPRRGATC